MRMQVHMEASRGRLEPELQAVVELQTQSIWVLRTESLSPVHKQ